MSWLDDLKKAKETSGMTIDEIVAKSNVAKPTVEKILSGSTKNPGINSILSILHAMGQTLDAIDPIDRNKKAPSISDEAKKMGERYAALDRHGQTMVGMVVAEEERRMEEERKARRSRPKEGAVDPNAPARVIPLYFTPPAAGFASPAFGEDFEYIEVGGDVPPQADFAVKIDGDSMEPYIMDGATVYVNRDPLANGDVGIFFLDGDMLCKQYVRDEEGNVRLLSLNRARADADRYIPADSELTLACHGRVILPYQPRPEGG